MGGLSDDQKRMVERIAARRIAAKNKLEDFFRYRLWQERKLDYVLWNWHITYICELLEACYRREIKRLIINVCPRHFKSELVQTFCAWMFGRDNSPRVSTVTASYNSGLAYTNSRKTREIVNSDWFPEIFRSDIVAGDELTSMVEGWTLVDRTDKESLVRIEKSAVKEWTTNGLASMVAAGVGGELTGKGGDFLIGDDLLKPVDANSDLIREKTNEWLGETFESRLNDPKDGVIIHIAQRLHELDPCGYLIEKMKDENAPQYEVATIPLIAEKPTIYSVGDFTYVRKQDELLHEERIDRRRAGEIKATLGPNFDGQYQQRPSKMEGGMLKPSMVQMVDKVPQLVAEELGLRPSAFIDLASKEKETQKDDPDWSVCSIWGKDKVGRYWLLDVCRLRDEMDVVASSFHTLCAKWDIWEAWGEKGALANTLLPYMRILEKERGRRLSIVGVPLPSTGDPKVQRAHGLQALLNAGLIWTCSGQSWWPDVRYEMAGFPRGAHDDIVDTFSIMSMLIDNLMAGVPQEKMPPTTYASGRRMYTGADIDRYRKQAQARHAKRT